jgi:hypothetical protein
MMLLSDRAISNCALLFRTDWRSSLRFDYGWPELRPESSAPVRAEGSPTFYNQRVAVGHLAGTPAGRVASNTEKADDSAR